MTFARQGQDGAAEKRQVVSLVSAKLLAVRATILAEPNQQERFGPRPNMPTRYGRR
jgi:hypothetical protein